MKFNWENKLILGVEEMDTEHMALIEKANLLFEALGNPKKSNDEILSTLDF